MNISPVWLITGASRGIGAKCARLAARAGLTIGVNYLRNQNAADQVVDDIRAAGGNGFTVMADVSKEEEVMAMFDAVDAHGVLTGLINNAGIVDVMSRVEAMSAARIERIFATNVLGSFICAREAVNRMARSKGGTGGVIVNVSSVAAKLASPGAYVDYAASKAAIDVLTKGLALETADDGIRVNAVRPGIIDTDIHASGGQPNRIAELRGTIPIKREGSTKEVARAILWLMSDHASYTTGAVLDVTGGR